MPSRRSRRARRSAGRSNKGSTAQPGIIRCPGMNAPRSPPVVTRTAMLKKAYTLRLTEESHLFDKEGVMGRISLQYAMDEFYKPVNYDLFRIEWIELTAHLRIQDLKNPSFMSNLMQGVEIYTSFDADAPAHGPGQYSTPLAWNFWSDRANIGHVTVTPWRPSVKLGRFRPAALNTPERHAHPAISRVHDTTEWYDAARASVLGDNPPLKFGEFQIYAHCNNYNIDGEKPFTVDILAECKFQLKAGV